MEDKYGREHLDEHLLAGLADASRTELHRFQVRDACKCVFYRVNRIVLFDNFDVSHQEIYVGGMQTGRQTWISSRSDLQSSVVTFAGWFGALTVERDFPPNMRVKGNSIDLAYP